MIDLDQSGSRNKLHRLTFFVELCIYLGEKFGHDIEAVNGPG